MKDIEKVEFISLLECKSGEVITTTTNDTFLVIIQGQHYKLVKVDLHNPKVFFKFDASLNEHFKEQVGNIKILWNNKGYGRKVLSNDNQD